MSKQCKNCGSNVSNEAKFCEVCGGSDFIFNNNTPNQPMYNQNQNQYNQNQYNQNQYNQQPPVNQAWQAPVPQNQPKKKNKGLIIGIVVVVLLVLAGIGFIAEKAFQDQGYGDDTDYNYDYTYDSGSSDDTDNNSVQETPEKTNYSKGTFDGSVYVNEWADITYALPEGFSDADSATYSTAENSTTECGMYFKADDSMSLIYICYEKLPTYPVYDEEKYLDSAMTSLRGLAGVTYNKIADTYSTTTIGGYTYTKAECEFNNGYGDFSNTFYVRKLDNYMICISTISVSSEANDALVSNITTVK